ncbi:hypothetical protein, partial [Mastigocoleus testarum]
MYICTNTTPSCEELEILKPFWLRSSLTIVILNDFEEKSDIIATARLARTLKSRHAPWLLAVFQ